MKVEHNPSAERKRDRPHLHEYEVGGEAAGVQRQLVWGAAASGRPMNLKAEYAWHLIGGPVCQHQL